MKKLKEKIYKIKSRINQTKYDKQKNDNIIDFSNKKQRAKFYKELQKEFEDYYNDPQKIAKRKECLDKKEAERRTQEQKLYERSIDFFENERF